MALKMVEDAEARGDLKPGGTIIECTSGNTGMGLALAAIVKGYKLICTLSDKQSKEKMDIPRAMIAEVIVCPTNVAPEPGQLLQRGIKIECFPIFYPTNTTTSAAAGHTTAQDLKSGSRRKAK